MFDLFKLAPTLQREEHIDIVDIRPGRARVNVATNLLKKAITIIPVQGLSGIEMQPGGSFNGMTIYHGPSHIRRSVVSIRSKSGHI